MRYMKMTDITELRKEFEPAVSNWTYLNAAACGLTPQRARVAMSRWWEDKLSHGSVHYHTWEEDALKTKKKFSTLIKASPDEIAYTMNTSEGLNFAINGMSFKKGDNVVVNKYDFPSNFLPWLALQEKGVEVRCVDIVDNRIPLTHFESLIDEKTRAVSISSVQFKSGFRCDLQGIGNLCKEQGIYFVVDAIQSLGALEMDVKKYNIDILCTACYKWMLGPDGVGFLYCNQDIVDEITTTNIGWMSTPDPWSFPTELHLMNTAQKFESGTLPWALIYAVDSILDMFNQIGVPRITDHIFRLLDYLIEELESLDVTIVSPLARDERSGILIFDVQGRDELAAQYQANNVRISVRDGIRVSPHLYNTKEDIDMLVTQLKEFLGG
jgi:selenocysteine lyase/cysteine desulfurase